MEGLLLPSVGSQPIFCFANSFASQLAAEQANQTICVPIGKLPGPKTSPPKGGVHTHAASCADP